MHCRRVHFGKLGSLNYQQQDIVGLAESRRLNWTKNIRMNSMILFILANQSVVEYLVCFCFQISPTTSTLCFLDYIHAVQMVLSHAPESAFMHMSQAAMPQLNSVPFS